MVKTYKKILFDLDNTLVDDDENRKYAIKQILIEREEEKDDERIEEFIKLDNQFWKDRAEGKIKDPYIFKTKEEKTEWVRTQRFIKYFENISFKEGSNINEEYIKYLSENIVPIKNAQNIIKYLYETFKDDIYISIMNQYTPLKQVEKYPEINRKVTDKEYDEVVDYAIELGVVNGFIQEGGTASESFIPEFDCEGV